MERQVLVNEPLSDDIGALLSVVTSGVSFQDAAESMRVVFEGDLASHC